MLYAVDETQPTTMSVPLLPKMAPVPPHMLLQGQRDDREFGDGFGFAPGPSFTPSELRRTRELIKDHIIAVASSIYPTEIVAELTATELEQFHTITAFNHAKMLTKEGRALPKKAVDEILTMTFFDYVRKAFGRFSLADELRHGYPQITFRLVRPGRIEDVGSLHRDDWFWKQYGVSTPTGCSRAKVWVPICSQPELDGLRVAVGSHGLDLDYRIEQVDGKLQFAADIDVTKIQLSQYNGEAGEPLFFNFQTLHVGSLNRSPQCRVSIETTIIYRTVEGDLNF